MADPLAGMVATVCSNCEAVFPIEQFAWADTQEPISRYYDRYRSLGTPLQNFLASRVGMYALAAVPFAIGAIGFLFVKNRWCIPAGLLAAIIVIFAHTVFLGPRILQQIVGTADPRREGRGSGGDEMIARISAAANPLQTLPLEPPE